MEVDNKKQVCLIFGQIDLEDFLGGNWLQLIFSVYCVPS